MDALTALKYPLHHTLKTFVTLKRMLSHSINQSRKLTSYFWSFQAIYQQTLLQEKLDLIVILSDLPLLQSGFHVTDLHFK